MNELILTANGVRELVLKPDEQVLLKLADYDMGQHMRRALLAGRGVGHAPAARGGEQASSEGQVEHSASLGRKRAKSVEALPAQRLGLRDDVEHLLDPLVKSPAPD